MEAFIDMHREEVSQVKEKKTAYFFITSVINNCEPNFEDYDDWRHLRSGRQMRQINEEDL